MVGNTIARILADKGYRGHNAPPDHKFRVFISGQKRGVTPKIKRELRRRAAVEPVIGHLKAEHRMGRNYLWFRQGDATNAVLAAAGYNFRRLIRWLSLLLRQILSALNAAVQALQPETRVLHGRLAKQLARSIVAAAHAPSPNRVGADESRSPVGGERRFQRSARPSFASTPWRTDRTGPISLPSRTRLWWSQILSRLQCLLLCTKDLAYSPLRSR